LRLAHRALAQAADHAARREEATAMAVNLEPKLTSLVKYVKDLQKQVYYHNNIIVILIIVARCSAVVHVCMHASDFCIINTAKS
jgi:hypothetical protein